jgi:hypothetical protein
MDLEKDANVPANPAPCHFFVPNEPIAQAKLRMLINFYMSLFVSAIQDSVLPPIGKANLAVLS